MAESYKYVFEVGDQALCTMPGVKCQKTCEIVDRDDLGHIQGKRKIIDNMRHTDARAWYRVRFGDLLLLWVHEDWLCPM